MATPEAEREAVLRDHRGDMFDAIDRLIADARAAGQGELEASVEMLQVSKRRAESRVDEAAERIEALEGALRPFAEYAELNDLDGRDPDDTIEVPVRDLLAARALLSEPEPPEATP